MEQSIYRQKWLTGLLLVAAMLLGTLVATAQDDEEDSDMVHAECEVTLYIGGHDEYKTVQYATFRNLKKAVNAQNVLRKAITDRDQPGATGTEVEDAVKKLGIEWKTSLPNGTFRVSAMDGQGVLIFAEEQELAAFEITKGRKKYTTTIKFDKQLREVISIGRKVSVNPVMKKVPGMDTGFETRFNVNLALPAGWTKDDCRLIIQPLAIDCQNEDTIAYLNPIVFEGRGYHNLQVRRMAYDYQTNDPLARGYAPHPILATQRPFAFDTTVVFRKPDKDKTYKGAYYCVLEDYHHVIWNNGGEGTGSCLSFKPFKFLNFAVAAAEMPLTDEFRETAESNISTVPRNLMLKFEVGSDKLTTDSVNTEQMNKLLEELRSYGERLYNVKVQGAASPEGNYDLNKGLADKRAAQAYRMLRSRLPATVKVVQLGAHIFTWQDVLAEVEQQGNEEVTGMVRNAISNNQPGEVYGILKGLPFYNDVIAPILERQRIMKCSYTYEREHVMDAAEAVEAFKLTDKKAYLAGTSKQRFSDGDYWNLFAAVKDSSLLDTLTLMAYKHTTSQPGYVNLKFSPYVANRMALLNIRRGTPDPNVLKPFIDYTVKKVDLTRYIDQYNTRVINRHEILINQAVNYFQEQKLDTASYILDWLPKAENTQKLRMFVTFSRNYIKYISGDCTPEEQQQVREAEDYVLNSNADNKAIIFSELHAQLSKSRSEAEYWVDKMDDNNPKKWYLKGILWSDEAGREPALGAADDGFRELSDAELLDLQQKDPLALKKYEEELDRHEAARRAAAGDKTPWFLAYFQHSFDLEPKYKRLYFNEGNVSDDIRKKYKYRSKDIPAYRRKFELLKAQRAPQPADADIDKAADNANAAANDNKENNAQ